MTFTVFLILIREYAAKRAGVCRETAGVCRELPREYAAKRRGSMPPNRFKQESRLFITILNQIKDDPALA